MEKTIELPHQPLKWLPGDPPPNGADCKGRNGMFRVAKVQVRSYDVLHQGGVHLDFWSKSPLAQYPSAWVEFYDPEDVIAVGQALVEVGEAAKKRNG